MTGPTCVLSLILGFVFVCQIDPSQSGTAVPVILWGSGSSDTKTGGVNPFSKMDQTDFAKILVDRMGQSQNPLIIFNKDTLCVEDLTRNSADLHQLTQDELMTYIPAVDLPMTVFKALVSYNQSLYDDLDGDSISDGQMIIKPITELSGIRDIYKSLKESTPNLIAVLTGDSCPYSRVERTKREAVNNDSTPFLIRTDRVLLYSSQGPFFRAPGEEKFVQLAKPAQKLAFIDQNGILTMKLIYNSTHPPTTKTSLDFKFSVKTAGYYSLSIAYTTTYANNSNSTYLQCNEDIVFPYNFSYHCSQNTVFYNSTYGVYLNITDMQVQVDANKFSDSYDCVNFTTIPIWTGLFVTAILALIMIWALTMIIDIRTMDRFDDPKGKTITISAQE